MQEDRSSDLRPAPARFGRWLMGAAEENVSSRHAWWKVMCLTGVDYFSTLGYQPGIAFLAAGALAPVATLVLVAMTVLVALPVYCQVAAHSPDGQGSLAMLEALLPRWRGKLLVLALLGFAATDFVITMTLSAADATDHIVENPMTPDWLRHPFGLTVLLLLILAGTFLRGFREAIGVAVAVVATYLALNVTLLAVLVGDLVSRPGLLAQWWQALGRTHSHPAAIAVVSILVFPKLALGLSGFETGVVVMPLVHGSPGDTPADPRGRVRNTTKLLTTAAAIMATLLVASSLSTTLLIPAEELASGGSANGRALAYLAHARLGFAFGTAYDLSTIAILWFAGASAMAGLLNLVPRYLPAYGMAPEWTRAVRPLVLVVTGVALLVTWVFDADVDAQGGAYATGVLVLMSSASLAVTLALWRSATRWLWLGGTLAFGYTTIANIVERPEGIRVAAVFIASIVVVSLGSRATRSTELRITSVELDESARQLIGEAGAGGLRLIAHRPDKRAVGEYDVKEQQARDDHNLDEDEPVLFLEVSHKDASLFRDQLHVRGVRIGRHRVLRCRSAAVPNAIAALLIHLRDQTKRIPDAYFGWTEGSPLVFLFRYVVLGEGDTAPTTREVLRRAVPSAHERPRIHVG